LAKEVGIEKTNELNEEYLKKVAGGIFTITAGAVDSPGW
jgi:hypothetical protein